MAAVVATVLASLAGMSGCGQKGPLYIPEPVVETPGPGDMKEAEDEETSQSG
ncbi:MAG: hypothetical protein F4Z15_05240 [Gammaproteobacteria bacterium]|nr:hypothetical protein [Gammaproteobacteria bacterium]MYD75739.1 hypothetical protein [Gammaproteobacteria bacterium]MYJ51811.1 hypothetical protein [Gammaproteobacteria bacterium]